MISKSLSQASFIVCGKKAKEPEAPKNIDWNTLQITYEQANQKQQEGYNIGLVCGVNDFFCIDADSFELEQACDQLLPPTYTERTCSGGKHFVYRVRGKFENQPIDSGGKHYGEIRSHRMYIVIAPSIAKNKQGEIKPYVLENEVEEIPYVTPEQIKNVVGQFIDLKKKPKDESRSGEEWRVVLTLLNKGLTREQVFDYMNNYTKWNEQGEKYREFTYKKALDIFQAEPKKVQELEIKPELQVRQYDYFKKLKKDKMGLVEKLIPEKSLTLNYGEPKKSKKTTFEFSKCIAISSGKKFLGKFKTKKSNCLYVDVENPDRQVKIIWTALRKFYGVRRIKTGFYYLGRAERINLLDPVFLSQLREIVQKKKIKYIVIDTLPKSADYDTNQEREVNRIFTQFFKPFIEEFSCSITFLLHTTKTGTSWIGTQAYLGIVDCAYEFKEIGKNRVKIISNNRGENIDFGVEYNFINNDKGELEEIQHYVFDVEQDTKVIPKAKFKELLECVKSLFPDNITRLKRKDIQDRLQIKGIIIASEKDGGHYSIATFKRVLTFLVENATLETDKGVYYLK